jgi:3-oxoacyl-[acyl-carrier protein] reductase
MPRKLEGRIAIVTGGARGLGRGYALRLAALGADVAILDRNLESAQVYAEEAEALTAASVTQECEAQGTRALGLTVDLTDRAATFAAVDSVRSAFGRIDILVCNAGGGVARFADEIGAGASADAPTTGTPSDCDEATLRRVLDINLMSCMYSCMAVAPTMKRQRAGKIVTVSSTAGVDAYAHYHPYGVAKAAIIQYTRSLAQELGPFNVNVNCIAPGIIRTARLGNRSHLAQEIALMREGTIEECARVVEFLTTDLSDYVTGRVILVDGGRIS